MNTPDKCDYDCTHCHLRHTCQKSAMALEVATIISDIFDAREKLDKLEGKLKFLTKFIPKDQRTIIGRKALAIYNNRKSNSDI